MKPSLESNTSKAHVAGSGEQGPWWQTPLTVPLPDSRRRDPAAPRALWRLIEIGEMAGLMTSKSNDVIERSSSSSIMSSDAVVAELQRFHSNLTELYVLVTLFAAAPHLVTLPILARETQGEPDTLRSTLDHLHGAGAFEIERLSSGESGLRLTSAGSRLAVLLMYRVITAAF